MGYMRLIDWTTGSRYGFAARTGHLALRTGLRLKRPPVEEAR
jgi:hypothetical protein